MMRDVNFPASLSLYGMREIAWQYRGSVRQLLSDITQGMPLPRGRECDRGFCPCTPSSIAGV